MKLTIFLLLLLSPLSVLFGQQNKFNCDLELIPRLHKCDTDTKKWESTFALGILPFEIRRLSVRTKENEYSIKGTVYDKTSEDPLPYVAIYSMVADSVNCNLLKRLAITGRNGKFRIKMDKCEITSIYFTTVAYETIELKIKNCR